MQGNVQRQDNSRHRQKKIRRSATGVQDLRARLLVEKIHPAAVAPTRAAESKIQNHRNRPNGRTKNILSNALTPNARLVSPDVSSFPSYVQKTQVSEVRSTPQGRMSPGGLARLTATAG